MKKFCGRRFVAARTVARGRHGAGEDRCAWPAWRGGGPLRVAGTAGGRTVACGRYVAGEDRCAWPARRGGGPLRLAGAARGRAVLNPKGSQIGSRGLSGAIPPVRRQKTQAPWRGARFSGSEQKHGSGTLAGCAHFLDGSGGIALRKCSPPSGLRVSDKGLRVSGRFATPPHPRCKPPARTAQHPRTG
jgi:hypothetical protein